MTSASTVSAGAAAIVPCQRGEIAISGSVGLEADFLGLIEKSEKTEIYRKTMRKVQPDIKACQGD